MLSYFHRLCDGEQCIKIVSRKISSGRSGRGNWNVKHFGLLIVDVVVQFYPWFNFDFLLFDIHYHMLA